MVQEALLEDPADIVSLYEELAILRQTVADATILYEHALDKNDPKMISMIGPVVREGMKDIADMVRTVADLEQKRSDKISIHNVTFVVNQIVRISAEVFGDDLTKADRFRKLVLDRLRVDKAGTTITPDQDVREMDESVPGA